MKKTGLTLLVSLALCNFVFGQKNFTLSSPDGKVKAEINIGKTIEYSVFHQTDLLVSKSPVSLRFTDGTSPGINAKLTKATKKSVNEVIDAVIYKKNKISDNYNELNLSFRGDYSLIFRAYNDGVAYRFSTNRKKPFTVENEQAEFNFPGDPKVYATYVNDDNGRKDTFEKQFFNSFENQYQHIALSSWNPKRLAFLPLVIEGKNISNIKTFYQEINRVFMQNEDWKIGESLDALNDLFYGGFGEIKGKEKISLIWENFEENKKALGLEMTKNFYESKLKSPEIFNTVFIKEKIEALENGNGQTYFEIIAEIIAEHSNIKLIEK